MTQRTPTGPRRRTVLSAIGTGLAASMLGATASAQGAGSTDFALFQGEQCTPVEPVRGEQPVREFYRYHLPDRFVSGENGAFAAEDTLYASAGTTAFQRAQTSIAFLYRGPEQLSLVVVHGRVDAADGGSVTFRLAGLPTDGEWVVRDDLYRDPETGDLAPRNYDRWQVDGTRHRIDWTWGSAGTDGGAFGGLGSTFRVLVAPAFNESAALYNQHYEGTITDWQFLSGADGQDRVSLRMDEPIMIATESCGGDSRAGRNGRRTEGTQTETDAGEETPQRDPEDGEERENELEEELEEIREEIREERAELRDELREQREEFRERHDEIEEDIREGREDAREAIRERRQELREREAELREWWNERLDEDDDRD